MGQHGDGAIGKVHTCAAHPSLGIQGRAGANIPGDIGDVNLKLGMSIRKGTHEDGIVEVAGGLPINGDDRQAAKVLTTGKLRLGQACHGVLCLGRSLRQDMGRKGVLYGMFADDDLHIDAEGVRRPKHLDDAAPSCTSGLGKLGDLDIHHQPLERPTFV